MKPLVYYDFKEINDGDEVAINKERLSEILEEVYQAGYNDGMHNKDSTTINYPFPINNPNNPTITYTSE